MTARLERTSFAPSPLGTPATVVALCTLVLCAVAGLVSLTDLAASTLDVWSSGRTMALMRGLAGFAGATVLGACALVALAVALPPVTGRRRAVILGLLVVPGVVGIAGVTISASFLAVGDTLVQIAGLVGLVAAALLCGTSLIAVSIVGRRARSR